MPYYKQGQISNTPIVLHAVAALQLRDFDDEAKVVGLQTPELQHFRQSLESCLSTENS